VKDEMDDQRNQRIKDAESDDLYDYFNDYLKEIITEDLKRIHGRKPRILDHDEPWVFHLDK